MIIYPAIDLMNGQCVRLKQGRFDEVKVYSDDPAGAVARFAEAGARWAHVVDLDGARDGAPAQHDLIGRLAGLGALELQVAGGFRTRDQVARMFDAGASRVVLGSLVVEQPETAHALLDAFGADRFTLALDVRLLDGRALVATKGWTETSERTIGDIAAAFPEARHVLVTDIGRDGMLQGPNLPLLRDVMAAAPHLEVQASGGVASNADLRALAAAGAAGAIVGKALWDGAVALEEALADAGA